MPHESAFSVAMRRLLRTRGPGSLIAEAANRQHGVVSRSQLLEWGMAPSAVDRQLRMDRLFLIHPGVYSVGHRVVSDRGGWMAAVLAGGAGTVLSHRSAAELWGILTPRTGSRRGRPGREVVEITVPGHTRSRRGLRRHCARLPADERTFRERIPVTTVSRTLLDLASLVEPAEFERALREAEVLHLPELPPLAVLLARYPNRRGRRTVRKTLEHLDRLPAGETRSHLEDRFLRFATRAGLPLPETNVPLSIEGRVYEVDCLWRSSRLIAELDGGEVHATRSAFETDRERDRRLQAGGWTVVRITWRQLGSGANALAGDLRRLLEQNEYKRM